MIPALLTRTSVCACRGRAAFAVALIDSSLAAMSRTKTRQRVCPRRHFVGGILKFLLIPRCEGQLENHRVPAEEGRRRGDTWDAPVTSGV